MSDLYQKCLMSKTEDISDVILCKNITYVNSFIKRNVKNCLNFMRNVRRSKRREPFILQDIKIIKIIF